MKDYAQTEYAKFSYLGPCHIWYTGSSRSNQFLHRNQFAACSVQQSLSKKAEDWFGTAPKIGDPHLPSWVRQGQHHHVPNAGCRRPLNCVLLLRSDGGRRTCRPEEDHLPRPEARECPETSGPRGVRPEADLRTADPGLRITRAAVVDIAKMGCKTENPSS